MIGFKGIADWRRLPSRLSALPVVVWLQTRADKIICRGDTSATRLLPLT